MNLAIHSLSLLLVFTILPSISIASETDAFTNRDQPLQDSGPLLDKKMEDVLSEIATRSQSCDETVIHANLISTLGGWAKARIESWVDEVPSSRKIAEDESVIKGSEVSFCCETSIRIGQTYLSGDKLGHFLHSGFEVYHMVRSATDKPIPDPRSMVAKVFDWGAKPPVPGELMDMKGDDLDSSYKDTMNGQKITKLTPEQFKQRGRQAAAKFSNGQEDGYWGLKMTGVKSYGDIAANDAGYQFWNELVDGPNPFFRCKNGKWERNTKRPFKFEDYVNDAWDEGINCSDYSPANSAIVEKQIKQATHGKGCPVEPAKCQSLAAKYGEYSKYVLHPSCANASKSAEPSYTPSPGARPVHIEIEPDGDH